MVIFLKQTETKMSSVKVTRSGIEEANKHLRAVYLRVQELDKLANDQHEAIIEKNEFIHSKLTEVNTSKDAEIYILRKQLEAQENKITLFQSELNEIDKFREILCCQEKLGASLQNEVDETKSLCITLETQHADNENTISSLRVQLKEKDKHIDYLKTLEMLLGNVAEHIPDARSLIYAMEKASNILKRSVVQSGMTHVPKKAQVEVTDEIPECGRDPIHVGSEKFLNLRSNNYCSSEIDVDFDAVDTASSMSVASYNEETTNKQRAKEFYL